jgi:alkyl hydroperoxide reductase subunit AhpC
VRPVFIIGPDNLIKLMLTYPKSVGRNFDEILHVLDALQLNESGPFATPARLAPRRPRDHKPRHPDRCGQRALPRP